MNFTYYNKKALLSEIIIILLPLVLYVNTAGHRYALDDSLVITKNNFTRQGFKGIPKILTNDAFTGFFGQDKDLVEGGRYRPLAQVTFAVEYEFSEKNPFLSHSINILLYGLSCLLFYRFLLLCGFKSGSYFGVAFWTSLIFAAHPLHTEVVANIKGRDELLALLFSLMTGIILLRAIKNQYQINIKTAIIAFLAFTLALLSKEMSVVFLLIIPLIVYMHTKDWSLLLKAITPMAVALIFYGLLRVNATGFDFGAPSNELMNNPFLEAQGSEKAGTILYVLGKYLQLLILPHPLTFDYYPYHIKLVEITNLKVILAILIYAILIFLCVYYLFRNKKTGIALFIYLVSLLPVSNIFINVGSFMNERFAYFASMGFAIVMGQLIYFLFRRNKMVAILLVLIMIPAYSLKTIQRNTVWKDDYTLFTHDVNTSFESAKSNLTAGGIILEKAIGTNNNVQREKMINQSISYLKIAAEIHPRYSNAYLLLGNAYWAGSKNVDSTLYYYTEALKYEPESEYVRKNFRIIATESKKAPKTLRILQAGLQYFPNDFSLNYKMGNFLGKELGKVDAAITYLERAHKIKPGDLSTLKDLGVAYGILGEYHQSLEYFKAALKQAPADQDLIKNIGITYQRMGKNQKAKEYFSKIN
jgi:tetratricopeptide (TPR) repeat protein